MWKMDEHGPFVNELPIEMMTVHTYVSLPQSIPQDICASRYHKLSSWTGITIDHWQISKCSTVDISVATGIGYNWSTRYARDYFFIV